MKASVDLGYGSSTGDAPASYDNFSEELEDRFKRVYTAVRENLQWAAERTKRYYDLRVRPQTYNRGDWVYYFNPWKFAGKEEKWCRKYIGPYVVVKSVGPVNVLLQKSKNAKPFCTHIDKVKPYIADNLPRS